MKAYEQTPATVNHGWQRVLDLACPATAVVQPPRPPDAPRLEVLP